jgi:DNA-binding MarR family transcriptional regulator
VAGITVSGIALPSGEYVSADDGSDVMTDNLRVFEMLVQVETRLWNKLDRALIDKHGIPLAWLVALRVVQASPDSRVQDLAEDLDISPGGASKLADRLVTAGLMQRAADDSDRRVSRLRLTARGRRLVRACSETGEVWLAHRLGDALGPRKVGELQSLLTPLSQAGAAKEGVA